MNLDGRKRNVKESFLMLYVAKYVLSKLLFRAMIIPKSSAPRIVIRGAFQLLIKYVDSTADWMIPQQSK